MKMSRNLRLTLFGVLYFAQGTMMSYFLTFNILYLGEYGYGPADVGIFQAVLVVPFLLKIFLGMLSDRVNLFGMGHRKPYILIGLLGQFITLLILPHVPVADGLGLFAVLAFIASTSMALYDTCTDGLALDTTPENEQGTVQGVMVGARAAGILVMLLVGGAVAENLGWSWVFYLVSLLAIPTFVLAWRIDEAAGVTREKFQWSSFKAFSKGSVLMVAAMGLIYALALDGVLTYLGDYVKNVLEVSLGNTSLLVALSMVGRIVGALSNSRVTDRIGHRQSLFVAIGLTSLACVGLALGGGVPLVALFAFLFGLAYGYYSAVYAAVAMEMSDPAIAASMFAIFMMFLNLGTVGGQSLGGILTEKLEFGRMALVMGGVNLLNLLLVLKVFKRGAAKTSP